MTKNCHGNNVILDNELHLWHINLLAFLELDKQDLILDLNEKKRKNRYIFKKHQLRYGACRKLLKIILGSYLNKPAKDIIIETTANGKPYLSAKPFYFNLSHSDDYMFLGICKNFDVGVDIECLKKRNFIGLAKHSFSKQESIAVRDALDDDLEQIFYKIWCQKEAFIKLDGRGLQYPLKDFSVNPIAQGDLLNLKDGEQNDYLLKTYLSAPGLFAAYCVKNSSIKVEVKFFDYIH